MKAEELEHSVTSSISDRLAGAVGTPKANSASEKVGVVPAIRSEMVFGFAALSSESEQLFLSECEANHRVHVEEIIYFIFNKVV